MKNEELKALKTLAEEAKELREEIVSGDYAKTDKDGILTHDAFVVSNKILHLLDVIRISAVNESLKWYDYGQIPSFKD